jgi:hypothetical protein
MSTLGALVTRGPAMVWDVAVTTTEVALALWVKVPRGIEGVAEVAVERWFEMSVVCASLMGGREVGAILAPGTTVTVEKVMAKVPEAMATGKTSILYILVVGWIDSRLLYLYGIDSVLR